jgi:hypothetical protein
MKTQFSARGVVLTALQWLGAVIAFVVSLTVGNMVLPLSKTIVDATPPTGIFTTPVALLLSGVVSATILIWAAKRSSFSGLAMWLQLFVLSFGVQTFMMQIETAYFITGVSSNGASHPAFPLLQGNFQVYLLFLHGFVTSLIFTLLVVLLVGGFSRRPRPQTNFTVTADHAVKVGAWLAVVYIVLYMVFGYYVAWQSPDVRLFYSGSTELPSVWNQWAATLMAKPELPVFQYFRGVLWVLCLIPLFRGFSGKRIELVALSALALALLTTAELTFPNPLMPVAVSLAHFREVSISMAIFGALCAWFVPQAASSAGRPGRLASAPPGPVRAPARRGALREAEDCERPEAGD